MGKYVSIITLYLNPRGRYSAQDGTHWDRRGEYVSELKHGIIANDEKAETAAKLLGINLFSAYSFWEAQSFASMIGIKTSVLYAEL